VYTESWVKADRAVFVFKQKRGFWLNVWKQWMSGQSFAHHEDGLSWRKKTRADVDELKRYHHDDDRRPGD
jgi:hypothetical protein